jgi:predicted DNA binding protein
MPVLADVGGVHLELVADADGWHNRTRFPDRESFELVYQFCKRHELDFTVDQIYRSTGDARAKTGGLSPAQQETLIEAVKAGYLDIPRGASLAELGDRLGVSESAASERFRRGSKTLIRETLQTNGADE